jgi:hypothetical protein
MWCYVAPFVRGMRGGSLAAPLRVEARSALIERDEVESAGGVIRELNDHIYRVLFKLRSERGEFWCECDDMQCEERVIILPLREYVSLRERLDEPLLSRSHARSTCPTDRRTPAGGGGPVEVGAVSWPGCLGAVEA